VVRWEYAIAMAGAVLGISPFDQPDVEAAKQAAAKVLEEGVPNIPVEPVEKVLSTVKPGDYIAIQAFIDTESPEIDAPQRARMALRDRYRVATTVGIGPAICIRPASCTRAARRAAWFSRSSAMTRSKLQFPGRSFSFSQLKQSGCAGRARRGSAIQAMRIIGPTTKHQRLGRGRRQCSSG
jgi:hypothetical protein